MENSITESSIANRINEFLAKRMITRAQFADTCGIPRPTVTQILSGKNKKIGDDIISLIHSAYPSVSIMWLMFGEGNMEAEDNSSGAKNKRSNENNIEAHPHQAEEEHSGLFAPEVSDFSVDSLNSSKFQNVRGSYGEGKQISTKPENNGMSLSRKHISKILVFYTDNSFEEFILKK